MIHGAGDDDDDNENTQCSVVVKDIKRSQLPRSRPKKKQITHTRLLMAMR